MIKEDTSRNAGKAARSKDSNSLGKAALPISTNAEDQAWRGKFEALSKLWRNNKISYSEYEKRQEELTKAKNAESAGRAQKRADEYLNGLLIIVGNRGAKALRFDHAFKLSSDRHYQSDLAAVDTPQNRQILHTLLSALVAVPDTWSTLDMRRFFSGTGEQGKAKNKFPGRAIFGKNSGWQAGQIDMICEQLVSDASDYANVLRQHKPVTINPPERKSEEVIEGFALVERGRSYDEREPRATPRDVEFIKLLCHKLEQRGLS